jgi:XTP/dITP diphosphohydrolase
MDAFDKLIAVSDILNGPQGCMWDRKQTFHSLQPYVIEEAHELIEAVDKGDTGSIIEELGDLLYTVIFYAKVAERESLFSLEQILDGQREKLIRRHPHVFAGQTVTCTKELEKLWDSIKSKEKGKQERQSAFDGIPPSYPVLARAQKVLKILIKQGGKLPLSLEEKTLTDEEIGRELLKIVASACHSGVDAESALRRALVAVEKMALESP